VSAGATAGATAAAAAAAARRRQEEEELTPYTPDDLAGGWQFKILGSPFGRFKNPDYLRAALEEEAQAGWTLVEKFDDTRIRLKRPASYAAMDGKLDFDPYRSTVGRKLGPGSGTGGDLTSRLLLIFGIVFATILGLGLIFSLLR
jgi:hypothetical protein